MAAICDRADLSQDELSFALSEGEQKLTQYVKQHQLLLGV